MKPRSLASCALVASAVLLADCRTAGDGSGLASDPTGGAPPPNPGGAPTGEDNVAYAQRCIAELGMSPQQVQQMTDWNCLTGTEAPVTFDDQAVTSANYPAFVQGGRKCDAPQWLTDGCHPFDFVQKKQIGDIEMVLNCRQKYFPEESFNDPAMNAGLNKWERFLAYAQAVKEGNADKITKYKRYAFLFNDMGWILRNSKSGKVCYFTYYDQDFFGPFVPAPNRATPPDAATFKATVRTGLAAGIQSSGLSPADQATVLALADDPGLNLDDFKKTSQTFYFPPSGNQSCVTCHAYGGYKYSPFISGARVLPSLISLSAKPFLPVGSDLDDAVRGNGTIEVKVNDDATCTGCHRLSSQGSPGSRGCNHFEPAVGNFGDGLTSNYTEHGKRFPLRSWMPLSHGVDSPQQFHGAYGTAIDSARCCCSHPSANGCSWRRYGPTGPEVDTSWRTGKAPTFIEVGFGVGDDTAVDCSMGHAPVGPRPGMPTTASD